MTPEATVVVRARRLRARQESRKVLLDVVLAVILPAVAISALYLFPFVRDPGLLPIGVDTQGYIWRTDVVRAIGLHSLQAGVFPPPALPLGSRPAYPVVAGILQSIAGIEPATFAWLSPAIFATIVGLAAGALAVDGFNERRFRAPIYAIGLGGSAYLTWTALGYAANLAFDGIALGIAVVVVLLARNRASPLLGGAMLGAGFLTHWMFATTFSSVLLAYAGVVVLALRAGSLRRRPNPIDPSRPAAPSLGGVVTLMMVGVAIGALGFAAAPEWPSALPQVNDPARSIAVAAKLVARDPGFLLVITVPLAIVALVLGLRGTRRWPAILLGLWASLFPVGLIAWYELHLPLPPYRWSAFALGLPFLAIAAGPWAGEAIARRAGPVASIVGVGVAVLVGAALVVAGTHVWWHTAPRMSPEERVELGIASRYLGQLPVETPVIVVVSPGGLHLPINPVFSGLPAERLPHVQVVGAIVDPESPDLGLGIPIPPAAVVLFPVAFNRRDLPSGTVLGPGVRLLAGPAPRAPIEAPSAPRAPNAILLGLYVALSLVVLSIAGWGWSLLVQVRLAGRLALAPAIGTAMLGVVGVLLARAGVRPDGVGAIVDLALTAVVGFVVVGIVRSRAGRERRDENVPNPTPSAP